MDEQNNSPEIVATTNEPVQQKHEENVWRRKFHQEEEARRLVEQRMKELESKVMSISQPQATEEDDIGVDNDEYVQAKHVRHTTKKIKSTLTNAQKELEEMRQKMALLEARVATSSLSDFEQVCSEENLQQLAREYPEDYECVRSNPNLMSRSKAAYNMIKRYGIMNSTQQNNAAEERIVANKKRPQAAAMTSPQAAATPLTSLNNFERRVLTEEQKEYHRREMERLKRMG